MITAAVARHLTSLGLCTYGQAGTDTFLEYLPGEPVDANGIYLKAGPEPNPYVGLRRPGVQIIVRRDPYSSGGRARSGYDVAAAMQAKLDGLSHVTLAAGTDDEIRVAWCLAQQSAPVSLGADDNGAPKWSVRFALETVGL